jgi:hypothetical protein
MRYWTIYLSVVLTLFACSEHKTVHEQPPIAGLWSLHAMEQKDSISGHWNEWRGGMQGYVLYDADGHMALHLTKKGYQDFELAFPNFVDTIPLEALKHLTNSYVYLANYTLDTLNHIVEHARVSHSNPAEWNDVVERRYSFLGDTLVLAPVEEKNKSLRLKWLRQ